MHSICPKGESDSNLLQIDLYDSHSTEVGDASYDVEVNGRQVRVSMRRPSNGVRAVDYVFIADELAASKFIHFFPRNRRIALLKESPKYIKSLPIDELKRNFDLILSHSDVLIREGRPFLSNLFSSTWISTPAPEASKTKMLSFVGNVERTVGEGYLFRADVAKFLAGKADLYGKGLKPIQKKDTGMRDYCFSVAMENYKENFYFSEKLIDCFQLGCIPIYWGCPAIENIFDRRGILIFDSITQLNQIVSELSFDLYQQMRPFALKNLRIAQELQLDSFEGFLARSVSSAILHLGEFSKPMNFLSVTKLMAGPRLALNNLKSCLY